MNANRWSMPLGSVLAGRYVIAQEIGRGGMGVIYEGYDGNLERPVAIKFLNAEFANNHEAVQRFQREALAASKLGHPNICNVYDRGDSDDGIPYIVMELLEGESLSSRLQRQKRLPPAEVALLMLQVLSALAAVHRKGIVHRDLKPDNIYIARDDVGDEQVKLVDFGISKYVGDLIVNKLTRGGIVMGTPHYVSPEAAEGHPERIDHRTDIWAVGVIMYEALTGNPPFIGESHLEVLGNISRQPVIDPRRILPSIPAELAGAVLRALEKNPKNRFADAAEFAAELREFVDSNAEASGSRTPFGANRIRPNPVPQPLPAIEVEGRPLPASWSAESSDTIPTEVWHQTEEPPPASPAPPAPPAPRKGTSFKVWLIIGLVVLALGGLAGTLAFVVVRAAAGGGLSRSGETNEQTTAGTEHEAPEPEASEPATAPTKTTPEPAKARPEPAKTPPEPAPPPDDVPEPPTVVVRLLGVPRDATVLFDGDEVEGNVIRGPMDHHGELVVTRPGQPPLRLDLTLTVGMQTLDIGSRLPTGD